MSSGDTGGLGRPPRILSLDGGGIRGKSSLLILENIMERVRRLEGLNEVPRPCEYFDLIGGTSTGGIIAMMLGRLGMTVDECIQAYDKVGQAAFTPKRRIISLPGPPKGAFSATALEGAIKQVVSEHCPECVGAAKSCTHVDLTFRNGACTKTVVLAITKTNVDARPTLFTTYDTSADLQGCSIWQIARATSAATTFFKSIQLGRDKIEFIDAGFGYNNPTEILIEEAEKLFPGQELRVLSIGTGLGSVVTIEDSRRSIIKALSKMASESTRVANRLDIKDNDRGHYHRFNVERGLDDVTLSDYEKTSKIAGQTRNYLADRDRAIQKFVDSFFGNAGSRTEVLRELDAPPIIEPAIPELDAPPKPAYYSLPFVRNQLFTGRDAVLQNIQTRFFEQECLRLAIVGLGGMGKTQVALQFVFWVKKNHPEYSVFWVSALSDTSFDQGYQDIARKVALQIGVGEDPKTAVKDFLMSGASGKWLLIIDNLDDGTRWDKTKQYLPQSEDGIMLFTTRSLGVAADAARRNIINLHEMDPEEAKTLLSTSLGDEDLIHKDEASAVELLEKLTYLPLAIVQAAAYLTRSPHLSIRGYLELLRGTDQDVVDLLSREFSDDARYPESNNAVATTWLVSFEQIEKTDKGAAQLLSFLSCIEPKAIPQSLLPQMGSKENQIYSLGILVGFAFLAKRGDDDVTSDGHGESYDSFYDMHSLVHLSTRIWIERNQQPEEALTSAIQHMETIFDYDNDASQQVWRSYFPHSIRLLETSKALHVDTRFDLSERVGWHLDLDRQFKEAIQWRQDVYEWYQKTLEEDDPYRLISEYNLASTYFQNLRYKDAIAILEHVVKVQKSLPEEDPERLSSERLLADAYLSDRRLRDAMPILERVVDIQKTLREEDHERLTSNHNLARAYFDDGRVKDAIRILERIVKVFEKTLREEDESRLTSDHNLARAYLDDGRVKDAIRIFERVVEVKKKTLREEDQSRLTSQHELARAYFNDGQVKDAIRIFEHVMKVRERTLREEDQLRLVSEYGLATAYLNDWRVKDAIRIFERIVKVFEKTLREEDESRLSSEHELARAYLEDGRVKDAIGRLEYVVSMRRGLYAEDASDLLASQQVLGSAYIEDGRIEDAIELLEHVVNIEKGLYAEDARNLLLSQQRLGSAYIEGGRVEDGIRLMEHVMEKGPQAEDDRLRQKAQHWLERAYSKMEG